MRKTFSVCCAPAGKPRARRGKRRSPIADLILRNSDFRSIVKELIKRRSIVVPLNPKFEIRNPKLSDHFIRPHQHVRRNRQADLLGGFQIDDELELRRLLDR